MYLIRQLHTSQVLKYVRIYSIVFAGHCSVCTIVQLYIYMYALGVCPYH